MHVSTCHGPWESRSEGFALTGYEIPGCVEDGLSWPNLADAVTADVNSDATTMDSASTISDAELEEACKYISDESSSGLSDAELEEACKMLMDPW